MKYEEICEKIMAVEESTFDEMVENVYLITEGTNIRFKREFKSVKKDVKESMKKARKFAKKGEVEKAISEIDKAIEKVEEYTQYLEDYDDTVGEMIAGTVLQIFCSEVKSILLACVTFGFGKPLSMIKDIFDVVVGLISQIKNDKDIDVKTFNMRKNKIIGLLKSLVKKLENLKKDVIREHKDDSSKTESVDIKLSIYESERSGDITVEQRDLLLEVINMA